MDKAIPIFNPQEPYKLRLSNSIYEYEQNGFKYNAVGNPIDGQEITNARPENKKPEEKIIQAPIVEEKKAFPCTVCDDSFDNQAKLDKHLSWHEEIGKIEENPAEVAEVK